MNTNDDTNADARFVVLDTALDEELGGSRPPDLWPALAAKRTPGSRARSWLAAALVLLGIGVVSAVAVLSREPEPAGAVQPWRIDVDPEGPATLPELQARFADARRATLTAEATWSTELAEFVQLVRFGGLERMFKWSLAPNLDRDDVPPIRDALRGATEGEVARDVVWTHAVSVGERNTKAVLLLQLRGDAEPRVAFASPRGPIALSIAAFPSHELRTELADVERKTIAALGVVIGADGFRAIPDEARSLRLHGVPAARVHELARFTKLENLELMACPAWHDAAVLRAIARLPIRNLGLRPDLLGADAFPVIGSIASLRELCLTPANWLEVLFGNAPVTLAPGLDDAALLALRELRQLDELVLTGGVFGDDALRALGGLPALRQLVLIGCTRIAGDALSAFAGVTDLSLLDCSGLREDFVAAAAKMPKLKKLGVRNPGCRLRLIPLRDAKELTDLNVSGHLAPDELRLLAEVPTLTSLALMLEPPLRDEDLIWLYGLRQLRTLKLANDAVTADGRAALQAALPRCKLSRDFW